ncbi:SIS domain-containing protein [Desulfovibrio fairfieldensis]|uniref:SIS domain-containing protein n=1 Tax=Desulfovibrio fairfieldensis TaxID=44742 RepID=A0A109W4X3_9BACT|nr:SIS domain-containing protein [Desulfovibrio fairfieldensis]AMD91146.1 hypothetical protein AXF13_13995 [Desulfovibrio fairfieldensis]
MSAYCNGVVKYEQRWQDFMYLLNRTLADVSFRDASGAELDQEEGFAVWTTNGYALKKNGACLYFAGNGASASMSSHFAADINKNADIHTQVFTDLALVTAIGNDIGYSEVYAYPLRRRAIAGDMLVTISSSGNSPNILKVIDAARELNLYVVTLSAMDGENACRQRGHLNVYVPAMTYGMAESAHTAILHYWTDLLVALASQA